MSSLTKSIKPRFKERPRGKPFQKNHKGIHHLNSSAPVPSRPGPSTEQEEEEEFQPVGVGRGRGRPPKDPSAAAASKKKAEPGKALLENLNRPTTRLISNMLKAEEHKIDHSNAYFIAKQEAIKELMNKGFKGHLEKSPECVGELDIVKTRQFGISTTWKLFCPDCKFESEPEKMYEEIDRPGRGAKPSSLNRSLGLALSYSSIGPTVMREILMTMGLEAGGRSSMQKNHNVACDIVDDMGTNEHLPAVRKSKKGQPISIVTDTQYNIPPGRVDTPYVASGQATTTIKDAKTGEILHCITNSKYCRRGIRRMMNKEKPDCPNHADGSKCTATINYSESISDEAKNFREGARKLKEDGVEVKYVTSDGDTALGPAVREEFGDDAEHFKDTRHFSSTIKKAIIAAKFNEGMFTAKLKEDRAKHKRYFAEDVRSRMEFEFKHAAKLTNDLPDSERKAKMFQLLEGKSELVVNCLSNDHSACHSNLCEMWQENRRVHDVNLYDMTESDKRKLLEIVNRRLGVAGITQTWRNENTQGSEAFHQLHIKARPKTTKHTRNYRARTMRCVLTNNMGFADSTSCLLDRIGHRVSGKVQKALVKREKERKANIAYHTRSSVKKNRIKRVGAKYWCYRQTGETGDKYPTKSE